MKKDALIITLCLAGTVFWLTLFLADLNTTLSRLNEQPVGIITFKYKAAQRRFIDRVLWDRLQKESPVYNGDFIRTAELSEATVTFSGGGAIDLSENSLIQIRFEGSRARIDLTEGGVSARTHGDSSLALVSGGNRVDVGPGGVVSAAAAGDGFTLRVVEGNASVSAEGGTRQAGAGEILAFAGSSAAAEEPQVVVLSPRPNARLLNPERSGLPVNFFWNTAHYSEGDYTRIEIAGDRGFTRILETLAEEDAKAATASLSAGTYFWRAYPVRREDAPQESSADSDARFAASGKLTVVYAPSPRTITPPEDSVYRFRTRLPAVRFQWTAQDEAAFYTVEAADNPELLNPVLQTQARGFSLVYSGLGAGRWYWRVRPEYPPEYEGTSGVSAISSFVIEQSAGLTVPVLSSPAQNGLVNISGGRGDVYFSWRSEAEADSCTLLISANSDLSNPVITRTVRDNFFVYGQKETALRAGQYYWGVYLTDTEGNNSPVSPVRSFLAIQGEVIQRTVFPPDNYTVADALLPDMRFTWKSNLPFQTRFQISDNPAFSGFVINEAVNAEVFQGRVLPGGTYYWRISAGSFHTDSKRFTIAPPFSAPALETPGPNGRVMIREGVPAVFRWQGVEGAEYYQLRLYSEANRGKPVYENTYVGTTTQAIVMDSYTEGNYVWTVQACVDEGLLTSRRNGLLGTGRFAMRKLRPVSLDYPPVDYEYPGLDALRMPGNVLWSSAAPVEQSRFVLSHNPNPLAGGVVMDIRNPGKTITLIRLPEGTYYWTIQAETEDGFDISAERPSAFRVLPVPLLPEAAGVLPEDSYVIGPEELRRSRTLAFTWQPVKGANGYIFSLFRENAVGQRRRILQSEPEETTFFTLEDLTVLLEQGDFVWQVEAVFSEPGPGIIQHGLAGESRFTVDVPLPVKVQPKAPGTLFGK